MFSQIEAIAQQLKRRLVGDKAAARPPVPPRRAPTRPPRARVTPVVAAEQPAATPAPASTPKHGAPEPRILSRGNNKNVYVMMAPDSDEDDVLRSIDAEAAAQSKRLRVVEDKDFDPYNSGAYTRSDVWR